MKTSALFLAFLFIFCMSRSQTPITGGSVSGIWNLSGSPYQISGSLMIPKDSTLLIEPGVTINFQGHYKLLVLGRLLAIGNAKDSIVFTSSDTVGGWYGIRFDNTASSNDSSKLSYCKIEWGIANNGSGGDKMGGGILFNNFSKVNVNYCTIRKCSNSQIYSIDSKPLISHCIISYCPLGSGIYSEGFHAPVISRNIISYNHNAGIHCISNDSGYVSIRGNTISYNQETGIYCSKLEFNIAGNIITHNALNANLTGGIWCDHTSGTIANNIITYNSCTSIAYSAGIFMYFTGGTIFNNYIANNTGMYGSGIYCVGSYANPVISNNVIVNNTATENGGAVFFADNNHPEFINNTIANNHASKGGGIYCSFSCSPSFKNCIFYGNTANKGPQVFLDDEPSDPAFTYCDIEGGSGAFDANGGFYTGTYTNTITGNPQFVAPSAGSGSGYDGVTANWTLNVTSPCINAGNPAGPYPSTDIAGNPRLFGIIDMGAYELQTMIGIKEAVLKNTISICPNPFQEQTMVHLPEQISSATYTVFNAFGQAVKSNHIQSQQSFIINRDALPPGIYYLQVYSENKIIASERLIIHE